MKQSVHIVMAFVLAMLYPALAPAQDTAQPFWPARTADELAVAPSPEVSALPQVRQAEVDLSTGTATLSYPLLEWTVGSYPVRIGLSYRVGAFTTDELPGWIGLGWNLTGAGAVSRTVMGQPDELRTFEMRKSGDADIDYISDLTDYRKDASLDRYSYNCPGGSGQFVIQNGHITQLPQTNNKIELIGEEERGVRDFRITTPDGTRYEFCERELISYHYIPFNLYAGFIPPDYMAVSSWHLSRIILTESADTIRYEYAAAPFWSRDHNRPTESITVREDPGKPEKYFWLPQIASGMFVNNNRTDFETSVIPQRIVSRSGSVEFTYDRTQAFRMIISGMIHRDAAGNIVKKITLATDRKGRYKLQKITITGADDTLIDEQQFFYHERDSHYYGDLFNYPNASSSTPYSITTMLDPETLELNARRKPNFNYAVSDALRQTVSATGIVTDYVYESNTIRLEKTTAPQRARSISDTIAGNIKPILPWPEVPDTIIHPDPPNPAAPDSTVTIGIRLKSIRQRDRITAREQTRTFSYSDGICNIDLLTLTKSDFISLSGLQWFYMPNPLSVLVITVYDTSSTLLYGSRMPGSPMESARIYYGKVTETVSGTGLPQPLQTDYEFGTSRCRLARLYGGRELDDAIHHDGKRSLLLASLPVNTSPEYRERMGSHIVRGYFREHIGAAPELVSRTTYQYQSGAYLPFETERRYYMTTDSICMQSGLHYEPLVRNVRQYPQEAVVHDYQTMDDISCFDIQLEASSRLLDSISITHHYADGSERQRTTKKHYAGFRLSRVDLQFPSGDIQIPLDRIVMPDSQLQMLPLPPWNTDSINGNLSNILIPAGETVREGGHTLEHHTAYSCMVSKGGFSRQAVERGLQTLPVREMWVMDGCDTLHRQYDYGRFDGAGGTKLTLPTAVTTTLSGATTPVDVQRIHGYTPYGRPLTVTQTGRPATVYEWGYGGDLLTALTVSAVPGDSEEENGIGLRTEYDWQPLVGCTEIRRPSDKTTRYSYKGNRLHRVTDGAGRLLTEYDYELHADTEGQYAGRNRITATSYLLDTQEGSRATQIFDGFTLAVADITCDAGSDGGDVAAVTRYDALGRPVARWLPMALDESAVADALKRDVPLQAAAAGQFTDQESLSRITYPDRPGTTPSSATLGGSDFEDHPQLTEETCSNPAESERRVVRWLWDGTTLQADGFYAAGELDCVRTADGDGRVTLTFTDCLGRQVLQRSATGEEGRYADTYTVSDPWGNPLLVLSPEACVRLGNSGTVTAGAAAVTDLLDQYAYIYTYDTLLRLRLKKLPGCAPIHYAYDTEGRLVYSRDGNQAQQGRRSFMLYDGLGRVTLTGTCRDALSEEFWLATAPDQPARTFDSADAVADLEALSASDQGNFAEARMLTATYYDGYSFLSAADQSRFAAVRPSGALSTPSGLVTGTLTAVLGPDAAADTIAPLLTVSYYDTEERVTATAAISHRGELLTTSTAYTRGGLAATAGTALAGGDATHSVTLTSSYDRHGRVTATQLSRDGGQSATIATNSYNGLGQLRSTAYAGGMERSYSYDMHGWLTGWFTPYVGQELLYAAGATPSYSGRVSAKITNNYGHWDRYDYSYDRLGRLAAAAFSRRMPEGATIDNGDADADFSTAYSYDLQGNMLTLTRRGLTAPHLYGDIDDITATYDGNRLSSLRDAAGTVLLESSLDLPGGSWTGSDFGYDANGNLTRDMSRGVADVVYNELNLPRRVEFADGGRIDYLYSAAGTKLAETAFDAGGNRISRRDYAGQFEFASDTLERVHLPEGFMTEADGAYHAYIADYQGNIVGVYNTATGYFEQYTDYYPYGLPHASATSPDINRRKYGAKELTTDLGLNLYDFAARWHNPAFPAFTTPDPLAEKYKDLSPYLFCGGDPVNFVDPSGMYIDTGQLSDSELEQWEYLIDILCDCSAMFNSLYSELQQSDVNYTIGVVSEVDGVEDCALASFNVETKEIKFKELIPDTVSQIIEELFHAYQAETDYGNGQMNKEFEACMFKTCVAAEVSEEPKGDVLRLISPLSMESVNNAIFKSIDNTGNTISYFQKMSLNDIESLFVAYNQSVEPSNVKSNNYYVQPTTLFIAIMSLCDKAKK